LRAESPKRRKGMTMSPKGEKRTAQVEVEDLHAEATGQSSGSVGPPVPDVSSGAPAGSSGSAGEPGPEESNQEMLHLCSLLKDVVAEGKVAEIFSPPRVAAKAQLVGLAPGFSIDLETQRGDRKHWDFSKDSHINDLMQLIDYEKPEFTGGSPRCGPFSKLQALVNARANVDSETREERLMAGKKHLRTAVSVYKKQMNEGRYFYHEHPDGAASWEEKAVKDLRTYVSMGPCRVRCIGSRLDQEANQMVDKLTDLGVGIEGLLLERGREGVAPPRTSCRRTSMSSTGVPTSACTWHPESHKTATAV